MIKINITSVILWEGHKVTYMVFQLGMHNLNLIAANIRQTQKEEYSIFKILPPNVDVIQDKNWEKVPD